MSASKIDPMLEQFKSEVGNFEKTLLQLIKVKKKAQMRSQPMMESPQANRRLQDTPIAIVGMASLFPEARNLQEYWKNIIQEVDCITDVPPSRWDVETFYDPDPKAPDKTYCKRGGFIPDVDFNPREFGLPPNILEFTDISQIIALVVAKQAMEDAGYGEHREFNRERAGVILGAAVGRPLSAPLMSRMQYPVWEKVLKSSGLSDDDTQRVIEKMKLAYIDWEENAFPGMLTNVITGRIANRLDFGGTNCAIDAACASSLSAFKMACSELLEGNADLMLTGGIDIDNSVITYLCFSKTPALSRSQEIRPFDAESDGMLVGEGVGMVVLKRLEDAERDGDRIYAVIKGIGSSSDGRYKSIYAPRSEGQARALTRAYADAGFSPATVGLIEAHGTGTTAGDPTEFAALNEVFSQATPRKQSIALGSVKSQIGHTKAAAGAASLIKVALSLHHKVLPATLKVTQPNPKLGIEDTPFYLNTKTRPWLRPVLGEPRRAGVSSFGFGGTNFHIVLEEYQAEHEQAYRIHDTVQIILLMAPTVEQLAERCQEVLLQLQSETRDRNYRELVNTSKTLEIPPEAPRLGFVASSCDQASDLLQRAIETLQKNLSAEAWSHPQGIYFRQAGLKANQKVVALFSGQGSQYLEMGRDLVVNFPTMRQGFNDIDALFVKDTLQPLSEVVFPIPAFTESAKAAQVQALQQTDYAQPAIAALSTGLYKILQRAGLQPDFVVGHSFGELTALWAAGVFSDADYYALVKARGKAMSAPSDPNFDAGAMLAVKGDLTQIEALLPSFPEVAIANWNSGRQVVLAGTTSAIANIQQRLQEQGYSVVLLPVAAAFHTGLVAHAQQPFAQAIAATPLNQPRIPVYSNVTGKPYPQEPQAIQAILKSHMVSQVFFKQEIEAIYQEGGYCFIEFGPKSILTNLVKEILGNQPHEAIALNANWRKNSDSQLREAATQLRVIGVPLNHFDPYALEPVPVVERQAKTLNIRLSATNYVSEKTKKAFDDALQNGYKIAASTPLASSNQPLPVVSPIVTPSAPVVEPVPVFSKPGASKHLDDALELIPLNTHLQVNALPQRSLRSESDSQNGHSQNGHSQNGHSQNGHSQNGHAKDGIVERPNAHPVSAHHGNAYRQASGDRDRSNSALQDGFLDQAVMNKAVVDQDSTDKTALQVDPSTSLTQYISSLSNQSALREISSNTSTPVPMQHTSEPEKQSMSQLSTNLYQHILERIEYSLDQFRHYQQDILQVHEQYLKQHLEYAQALLQFTQQQNTLLTNGNGQHGQPSMIENLERSIAMFHQHHGETLRVHEQALQQQMDYAKSFFQVIQQQYANLIANQDRTAEMPQAAPVSQNEANPIQDKVNAFGDAIATASTQLTSVRDAVSAAIASPQPVISAAVAAKMPVPAAPVTPVGSAPIAPAPVANPPIQPDLSARTEVQPPAAPIVPAPVAPPPVSPTSSNEAQAPTDAPGIDVTGLVDALLAIVSEKTGYPTDMLELDLDIEADLGIDSIKRVEILAAMQQQFPDYPAINPEEIGELRTLGQIIDQMKQYAASASVQTPMSHPAPSESANGNAELSNAQPSTSTVPQVAMDRKENQAAPAIAPDAEPELVSSHPSDHQAASAVTGGETGIDVTGLVEALLAIVSEKTGYPTDMLELDLDIEADLGIDSIKRVEILAAMQQQFPDYPAINPEEIGELRTLGQIIDQMKRYAASAEKKTAQSTPLVNHSR